jgi:hypothetical protein
MHLTLDYTPVESELSTPSDIIDDYSVSSELQQAWLTDTFTMSERNYADQYGCLTAPSQDWTPSSAVRYNTTTQIDVRHGSLDDLYLRDPQVSSFNLPLRYDSTLTTPVSLNAESPATQGKNINESQWGRVDHSSMYQQLRHHDGLYVSANSMSMKSKNHTVTLPVSDTDSMLSMSPFLYGSPSTDSIPCPPTPYWGSNFMVSAPQETSASTSTTSPEPRISQNQNLASNNRAQAPILMAPNPSSLRPRQNTHDENRAQTQQQVQSMEPNIKVHQQYQSQQQIQPQATTVIKRESTPMSNVRPKRRRRSAPPVEGRKPLSKDDLSEEDKVLLHLRGLKEEEKFPWSELTARFNKQTGGNHKEASLQMRHTRMTERMRVWTEAEVCYFQTSSYGCHSSFYRRYHSCYLLTPCRPSGSCRRSQSFRYFQTCRLSSSC